LANHSIQTVAFTHPLSRKAAMDNLKHDFKYSTATDAGDKTESPGQTLTDAAYQAQTSAPDTNIFNNQAPPSIARSAKNISLADALARDPQAIEDIRARRSEGYARPNPAPAPAPTPAVGALNLDGNTESTSETTNDWFEMDKQDRDAMGTTTDNGREASSAGGDDLGAGSTENDDEDPEEKRGGDAAATLPTHEEETEPVPNYDADTEDAPSLTDTDESDEEQNTGPKTPPHTLPAMTHPVPNVATNTPTAPTAAAQTAPTTAPATAPTPAEEEETEQFPAFDPNIGPGPIADPAPPTPSNTPSDTNTGNTAQEPPTRPATPPPTLPATPHSDLSTAATTAPTTPAAPTPPPFVAPITPRPTGLAGDFTTAFGVNLHISPPSPPKTSEVPAAPADENIPDAERHNYAPGQGVIETRKKKSKKF
jgi:hypothetical protein